MTTPRIYVACLASYNAGTLHGRWIDADQDPDDIEEEVRAMLAESPEEEGAEEWAIHDHEGFYGMIEEHGLASFADISRHANLIAEHGDAWPLYVAHVGLHYATEGKFGGAHQGIYDTPEDYAAASAVESGMISEDHPMYPYIDWERYVRTLESEGVVFLTSLNGVHVFES